MFDFKSLDNSITNALKANTGNDSTALVNSLYGAIAGWLQGHVINYVIAAAVIAAIVFVFYGAMLYFTAYGDENRATQAKKTILYAFVGLLIAALAFTIISFVQGILIAPETPATGVQIPTENSGNRVDVREIDDKYYK